MVDRVGFNFHNRVLRERPNSFQSMDGFDRHQRKEVIDDHIARLESPIDSFAVKPVDPALFAGQKREISSYLHAWRNQLAQKHVCAQMHVMMAVYTRWLDSVQALEFFQLDHGQIFE